MKHITYIIAFVLIACGVPTIAVKQQGTVKPAGPVVLVTNATTGARCSAVVVDNSTLLTSRTCIGPINGLYSGVLSVWTSFPDSDDTAPGTNESELGTPVLHNNVLSVAASWADTYAASTLYDIALVHLLRPLPTHSTNVSLSYASMKYLDDVSIVGWGCAGEAHSYSARFLGAVMSDGMMFSTMNDDMHNIGIIFPTAPASATMIDKCQNDLGAGVFDADGNVVAIVSSYPIIAKAILPLKGIITVTMLGAVAADMKTQLTMHATP